MVFTGWHTKISLFFFGDNFYKNMATFKIFSPQILEVYRILLVETTLEPYYVRSMHRAAVWQHSSNLNIKIVYNLFLVEFVWFLFRWCPPLSVDCCRKLFPSVTPSENSQVGWDNRNRIAKVCRFDAKWVCLMESYAWSIQVFCLRKCSGSASFFEQNTWIPQV